MGDEFNHRLSRAAIKELLEGTARHIVRQGAVPEDVIDELGKLADNKAFENRLLDIEYEEEDRGSWGEPWRWWKKTYEAVGVLPRPRSPKNRKK